MAKEKGAATEIDVVMTNEEVTVPTIVSVSLLVLIVDELDEANEGYIKSTTTSPRKADNRECGREKSRQKRLRCTTTVEEDKKKKILRMTCSMRLPDTRKRAVLTVVASGGGLREEDRVEEELTLAVGLEPPAVPEGVPSSLR